jgi:parallel beta-helix repeat protein
MRKKLFIVLFSIFLLIMILLSTNKIKTAVASGTIYINADGSISPASNIVTTNNIIYTLTDNINDSIVVYRGNIIIDGAGYTLQNPSSSDNGILVDSVNNVTIKNVKIKGFIGAGVFLYYAMQCKIQDNILTENGFGIETQGAVTDTIISGNKIINNTNGIYLQGGSKNQIYNNDIMSQPHYGLRIHFSSTNNTIYGNNIIENNLAHYSFASIEISGGSRNNKFYHNNIEGDSPLVYLEVDTNPNLWDNGSTEGGNYWSDYIGTDGNGDGIGDTPYNMSPSNIDNYPFISQIGTVTRSYNPFSQELSISSNSIVQAFAFDTGTKQISFSVTGTAGSTGFCDVVFPSELLSGTITVYKDDALLTIGQNYTQSFNGTHYILHITYLHSTHTLKIKGTEVIPELTSLVMLSTLIITTLIVLNITKKQKRTKT